MFSRVRVCTHSMRPWISRGFWGTNRETPVIDPVDLFRQQDHVDEIEEVLELSNQADRHARYDPTGEYAMDTTSDTCDRDVPYPAQWNDYDIKAHEHIFGPKEK